MAGNAVIGSSLVGGSGSQSDGPGAYDTLPRQRGELVLADAELVAQHLGVVLAEGRCRAGVHRAGPAREPGRQHRIADRTDGGMRVILVEPARDNLRRLTDDGWTSYDAGRDPGSTQRVGDLVTGVCRGERAYGVVAISRVDPVLPEQLVERRCLSL